MEIRYEAIALKIKTNAYGVHDKLAKAYWTGKNWAPEGEGKAIHLDKDAAEKMANALEAQRQQLFVPDPQKWKVVFELARGVILCEDAMEVEECMIHLQGGVVVPPSKPQ